MPQLTCCSQGVGPERLQHRPSRYNRGRGYSDSEGRIARRSTHTCPTADDHHRPWQAFNKWCRGIGASRGQRATRGRLERRKISRRPHNTRAVFSQALTHLSRPSLHDPYAILHGSPRTIATYLTRLLIIDLGVTIILAFGCITSLLLYLFFSAPTCSCPSSVLFSPSLGGPSLCSLFNRFARSVTTSYDFVTLGPV